MKTEHTKGIWEIEHEYNIVSESGRSIASAGTYSSNVNSDQVREENMANAKLISAAPDLFELANYVHTANFKYAVNRQRAKFLAKAAIEKVTK